MRAILAALILCAFASTAPGRRSDRLLGKSDRARQSAAAGMMERIGERQGALLLLCRWHVLKFCTDSTHALKGRDVPLPDLPVHLKDDAP